MNLKISVELSFVSSINIYCYLTCSLRKDPLAILEVLNLMGSLGRTFDEVKIPKDTEGRTFVTAWFSEDENAEGSFLLPP